MKWTSNWGSQIVVEQFLFCTDVRCSEKRWLKRFVRVLFWRSQCELMRLITLSKRSVMWSEPLSSLIWVCDFRKSNNTVWSPATSNNRISFSLRFSQTQELWYSWYTFFYRCSQTCKSSSYSRLSLLSFWRLKSKQLLNIGLPLSNRQFVAANGVTQGFKTTVHSEWVSHEKIVVVIDNNDLASFCEGEDDLLT